MQDLMVENISVVDELGAEVSWRHLDEPDTGASRVQAAVFRTEAKNRLLKQIIRKHLVSQGMKTDGALVEICRVET